MKDINLCKCNHCGNILIDENPQINAPLYDLKDYPNALGMVWVSVDINNSETDYLACPVCLTDGYLVDDID